MDEEQQVSKLPIPTWAKQLLAPLLITGGGLGGGLVYVEQIIAESVAEPVAIILVQEHGFVTTDTFEDDAAHYVTLQELEIHLAEYDQMRGEVTDIWSKYNEQLANKEKMMVWLYEQLEKKRDK